MLSFDVIDRAVSCKFIDLQSVSMMCCICIDFAGKHQPSKALPIASACSSTSRAALYLTTVVTENMSNFVK